MTHRDALRIAVELQHHKLVLAVHAEGAAVLLHQVLGVACAFQTVGKRDGRMTALHLDHSRLVLAAHGEHAFEDFPWVFFQLLVSEAHAAILLVEFEHDNFDFVPYVAKLRGVLDLLGPAEVRDVHQTVDAFFQLDEEAEVGEVAHRAFLLGLHRVTDFDVGPWILRELLEAERHLAPFAVDAQNHAFDFVVDLQEVLRAAQVLRPRDFADVEKTLHTWRDFHKGSIIGHDHHAALDLGAFDQVLGECVPWVRRELLHAQGDALLLVVEVQNHHVDFLVHFHHLFRMAHTAVAHVGDVHQAIDAAQVHEHPVRGDVLDRTLEHLTHFEALDDEALLLLELGFDKSLVRHDHVLKLLVDLDNLEFHLLSNVFVEVTDGLHIHLRPGQERLETKHVDNQATLGAAFHRTLDDHVFVLGLVHLVPSVIDARSLVADHELTIGVFLLFNEHGNLVPSLELGVVSEFRCADDAL